MRVAFLTGAFPVLSETFILGQITGLLDRGVDVRIFSYERPSQTLHHSDVDRYELPGRTTYLPQGPRGRWGRRTCAILAALWFCLIDARFMNCFRSNETLKGFLDTPSCALAGQLRRAGEFDVVHAQFGILGAKAARLKASRILECPLVTSFRGGDTTILLSQNPRFYEHLFRWGDVFLPVSRFLRDRLEAHGCPPDRIAVHHSALDLGEFVFRKRSLPARGPIELLCIARLVEVKGVRYAIDAMGALREMGVNARLHVLGDGPLRKECESLIARLGLNDRVALEGDCSKARVRGFLDRCQILICPSIVGSDGAQEGMPNAVKEAMACGLPVVATDTGGIPELVQDGVTGRIVPPKDGGAIAAAVAELVRSPESWASLCHNARRVIENEFDSRRLNDRLVSLYRDLAENTRAAKTRQQAQDVNRNLGVEKSA